MKTKIISILLVVALIVVYAFGVIPSLIPKSNPLDKAENQQYQTEANMPYGAEILEKYNK